MHCKPVERVDKNQFRIVRIHARIDSFLTDFMPRINPGLKADHPVHAVTGIMFDAPAGMAGYIDSGQSLSKVIRPAKPFTSKRLVHRHARGIHPAQFFRADDELVFLDITFRVSGQNKRNRPGFCLLGFGRLGLDREHDDKLASRPENNRATTSKIVGL
jgi:hypothetical protein